MEPTTEDRSEIAFFDLETIRTEQGCVILEFGAILVCPRTLVELQNYSTFVRPADPIHICSLTDRSNGITKSAVDSAPTFAEIADIVYDLLHGRIWAGHNMRKFDSACIRQAFTEIKRPVPEPKTIIDSLELLTRRFGRRAGDMKMASLATHFGLGTQTHRSLEDVRMNLQVIKCCATVLFLESSIQDKFTDPNAIYFLEPDDISIPSISVDLAPSDRGSPRILVLHRNFPLKLCCRRLNIELGFSTMFVDHVGRTKFSFLVNPSPSLCEILDKIDSLARQKFAVESGSCSEWRPVVRRNPGFFNSPTVRLNLPIVEEDGDIAHWDTEIYRKDASTTEMVVFSRFDVRELDSLFTPGNLVDAYFSFKSYDYQQNAGIRLVAQKLIVHS
ncbi:hypothetical protein Pfo_020602 [Paulownia fortunei]|nr:hypothetical protein Pfo_020602 [Paulownia fortunei]